MLFERFYLGCLSHASYLVGDEETRVAAVVDPQRDIAPYLEFAERHALQIRHVFLTHLHADFIAGHLELRDRVGATIHLGARAQAEYPFVPARDGDAVAFGSVRLETLETPGHTPESISVLVYDLDRSGVEPFAVLTGDTLFIGDVGRPDLRGSLGWSAAALGRLLYGSLHGKLATLPPSTRVYPAHGAGSLCGKQLSAAATSTIAEERRSNYALQPMSEEDFVSLITADQPDAPSYFTYDAVLNARERPTLDVVLQRVLRPIAVANGLTLAADGATLLDVRDAAAFAAGHVRGAINIGLGGQYATWAGTLLSRERPIVIIADPGRESEAAIRLGRIGFDHIAGYLDGGMQAVDSRPDLIVRTDRVTPLWLASRLKAEEPPIVLDVRTPREWTAARIDSSMNIPLNRLQERMEEVPRNQLVVVHCAAGYRSSTAASLLQLSGFDNIVELTGGMAAWQRTFLAPSDPAGGPQ